MSDEALLSVAIKSGRIAPIGRRVWGEGRRGGHALRYVGALVTTVPSTEYAHGMVTTEAWACDHRHRTRDAATTCAAAELGRRRRT